jgi:hypothetical protein
MEASVLNKKLWVCAAVGALVGATAVQTIHSIRDRSSRELFGERMRCKVLADRYVKDHSGLTTVVVSRIEFSRGRSSCIVGTMEQLVAPMERPSSDYTFKIVDLLTGEELFSRMCSGSECAETLQKQKDAFNDAR